MKKNIPFFITILLFTISCDFGLPETKSLLPLHSINAISKNIIDIDAGENYPYNSISDTHLWIYGKNFIANKNSVKVKINDIEQVIEEAYSDSLLINISKDSESGKISVLQTVNNVVFKDSIYISKPEINHTDNLALGYSLSTEYWQWIEISPPFNNVTQIIIPIFPSKEGAKAGSFSIQIEDVEKKEWLDLPNYNIWISSYKNSTSGNDVEKHIARVFFEPLKLDKNKKYRIAVKTTEPDTGNKDGNASFYWNGEKNSKFQPNWVNSVANKDGFQFGIKIWGFNK